MLHTITKPVAQNISAKTCIDALSSSFTSRRAALQIEIAVGLAVFAAKGEASREAKALLTGMYGSAGYQCLTPTGIDYKTVNRRVNLTAKLYEVIGAKLVSMWIGNTSEHGVISAIMPNIEPMQFFTYDDVNAFCGNPTNKTARQQARALEAVFDEAMSGSPSADAARPFARRADDQEGSVFIDTPTVHVRIPAEAAPIDLIDVAARVLEVAKEKQSADSPF